MRPEDLVDVSLLAAACGRDPCHVPDPDHLDGCLVLDAHGTLAGHLAVAATRHGSVEVVDLYLLPCRRGRGHASEAVGMLAAWAVRRSAALEVSARDGSDGFWSRMRFVSVAGRGAGGAVRMVRLPLLGTSCLMA